ncbi:NAD(P)-dependent oxidoreductase [Candidatus Sumerlaeota bacterium]|nr:NAD(P)-dependent oxidoreductase [Candidatus Sumerlaeota bacterium]
MKILLTGATGFIGRPLLRLLREEGHEVTAVSHTAEKAKRLRIEGVDVVRFDLTHHRLSTDVVKHCEAVIHLAGSSPESGDSDHCSRLDLIGTEHLLEAVSRAPVSRFIHISCTAVMGDHGGEWVTEAMPPAPQTPHGQAKLQAEELILNAHQIWRLPAVILRMAHVYGPGSLFGQIVEQMQEGRVALPRRVLQAQWGLISLHDAVRAIHHALTHGRTGEIYFVADGKSQTVKETLTHVAKALDLPHPTQAGLIHRWRGDRGVLHALSASARPRIDKMKTEMHFRPEHRSLEEGLLAVMKGPGAAKSH